MKKKTKTREIKLPMRFNPGTQKYEPVLPLRKIGKKVKIKLKLRDIIMMIVVLIMILIFIIALKNYPF